MDREPGKDEEYEAQRQKELDAAREEHNRRTAGGDPIEATVDDGEGPSSG